MFIKRKGWRIDSTLHFAHYRFINVQVRVSITVSRSELEAATHVLPEVSL